MSMKAGTYIRDGAAKTADAVSEGTRGIRNSKFATATGETVSQIGTRAAESGFYLYNMTKSTFAPGALSSEVAKEAR
jgi:hypothetical protein